MNVFPIVIVEDRYQGVYSGHRWLAFPDFQSYYSYHEDLEKGVWGDDVSAAEWAHRRENDYWGGATPDEALEALREAHKPSERKATSNSLEEATLSDLQGLRYDDLAI
jgi:hypothetical protein